MEPGWIKFFNDGQRELGLDSQVKARTASWQHGRLDGLIAVRLKRGPMLVMLKADEGDWWQSDTLMSKFSGYDKVGQTLFLASRIQRKIAQADVGKFVSRIPVNRYEVIFELDRMPKGNQDNSVPIEKEHINKWFTVTIDLEQRAVVVTFVDKRI
jgi:hypothetical protein